MYSGFGWVMNTKSSPCIKVCKLDAMGKYCIGCGRTLDQIKEAGNGKNRGWRRNL